MKLVVARLKHPIRRRRDIRHLYNISPLIQSKQRTPKSISKEAYSKASMKRKEKNGSGKKALL